MYVRTYILLLYFTYFRFININDNINSILFLVTHRKLEIFFNKKIKKKRTTIKSYRNLKNSSIFKKNIIVCIYITSKLIFNKNKQFLKLYSLNI